jgi:two-component system sensor histidine kinase RegB
MRNDAPNLPIGGGERALRHARSIHAPLPTKDATNRKNMVLLIQLRWIAVVGQIVTIAFVTSWFGIALPLLPMAAIISRPRGAQHRQPCLAALRAMMSAIAIS